jgi:hypothetical protein
MKGSIMRDYLKAIILLFVWLVLASCASQPTPDEPAIQTTPTAQEALQTPISGSNPTPLPPTNTPLVSTTTATSLPPTITSTPAPTGLNPTGPYVIFFAHSGIWITNPDGSFPTRISDYELSSALDVHRFISPTGDRLALVTNNEQGLDLVIVKIPSGEEQVVAHLIDAPPAGYYDPTSANSFATYAIRDYDSLAWQPGDGRLLAFVGAMNGPTADLYLYDTQTREITQLTDGPSQAVLPVWSPDGQYILHYGVSWVPPFGGAIGSANRLDGLWAVRISDGELITQPKPEGSVPHFVGWQDDSYYITYDPGDCFSENLRSIDVVSGKAAPIMNNGFWQRIAQSPENRALLFSSIAKCENSLGEGIFLLPADQKSATKLHDVKAWEIYWMPESNVFDAYPEALFSSDGHTRYDPPVYESSFNPAVSKLAYQAWNVIQNRRGRVMVKVPNEDWQTILDGIVAEQIWDPVDGKTLLIAMEDGSLYAASSPDFSPQIMGDLGSVNDVMWSPLPVPITTATPTPDDIGPFHYVTSLEGMLENSSAKVKMSALADGSVSIISDRSILRWSNQGWEVQPYNGDENLATVDESGKYWLLQKDTGDISNNEDGNAASGWISVGPFSESWWSPTPWRIVSGAGDTLWAPMAQDVRFFDGNQWSLYTQEDMGFPLMEMEDIDIVHNLALAQDGTEVWVGECYYSGPGPMGGGGVRWFDGQTWHGAESPIGSRCVSALDVDSAGNVWLGTSKAVWRYDHEDQSWTQYNLPAELLSDYSFTHPLQLMIDQAGDAWVMMQMCGGASCDGEVYLYRIQDGIWSLVTSAAYRSSSFKQMALDGNGQAWLFWEGMVYQLDDQPLEPVASMQALGVDADPSGTIWVVVGSEDDPSLWVYEP